MTHTASSGQLCSAWQVLELVVVAASCEANRLETEHQWQFYLLAVGSCCSTLIWLTCAWLSKCNDNSVAASVAGVGSRREAVCQEAQNAPSWPPCTAKTQRVVCGVKHVTALSTPPYSKEYGRRVGVRNKHSPHCLIGCTRPATTTSRLGAAHHHHLATPAAPSNAARCANTRTCSSE